MAKYRELVSFDEKNFFDIVIDNGRLIMNPTRDDLKGASPRYYNLTNVCPVCRKEWKRGDISELTEKNILYSGNALRETCENGKKIEKWVCHRHGNNHYQKYDPDSVNSIVKSMRDHRTGTLHNPAIILGDNCEKLTDKIFGTKRLSVIYDNYGNLPLDHTPILKGISIEIRGKLVDLSGMVLQTAGRRYNSRNGAWNFASLEGEWYKEFDVMIFWCISEDGSCVDRGYMIAKKEIYNPETKEGIKGINIYKNPNPSRGSYYERYRITDEEFLKRSDEKWKKIIK